jgi:hypothetical protein
MYTTQGDYIERFMIMPPPDYPTIDNVLMVQPSDKECWWSIHREKSAGEITANQKENEHCHEPGLGIVEMVYRKPLLPFLPVKDQKFPYTAPIIRNCSHSDWGECSKDCVGEKGPGTQTRTIKEPELNGGSCDRTLEQKCNFTNQCRKRTGDDINVSIWETTETNKIIDGKLGFAAFWEGDPTKLQKNTEWLVNDSFEIKVLDFQFGAYLNRHVITYETASNKRIKPQSTSTFTPLTPTVEPPPVEPPPPVCNKNWTMCSEKCISGIKRRYNDECKIEEKPCRHLFKLMVYSDRSYLGKTKLLTCTDMEYVHNVHPQWFSLKVYRPFGIESYKWIEWDSDNIENIHAEFTWVGITTHKGSHATDLEGIEDPEIEYLMVHIQMKGDGDISRVGPPPAGQPADDQEKPNIIACLKKGTKICEKCPDGYSAWGQECKLK